MEVPEEIVQMIADFIERTHVKGPAEPDQDNHITLDRIYWRIFRRTNANLSIEAQRSMEKGRRGILRRSLAKLVRRGQIEVYKHELNGREQNCFRPFDVLNELAKV